MLFEVLRFKHCISSLPSGSVTPDAQEKSNEIGFGESMRAPFFLSLCNCGIKIDKRKYELQRD